jgi:hypothetical protein
LELHFIENLEKELQELYELLDKNNDREEKQNIQMAIQVRNFRLSRILCE